MQTDVCASEMIPDGRMIESSPNGPRDSVCASMVAIRATIDISDMNGDQKARTLHVRSLQKSELFYNDLDMVL